MFKKNSRKEIQILYQILKSVFAHPQSQGQVFLEANLNTTNSKYYLKRLQKAFMIIIGDQGNAKSIKITDKGKNFYFAIREYAEIEG